MNLTALDGMLIDPARCHIAEESMPADWTLAETVNGVAISGEHAEAGARVLTYSVRVEGNMDTNAEDALPEIQATYVVTEEQAGILGEVSRELRHETIPPAKYGPLDAFGHLAMGPVPCMAGWRPVGEWSDDSGLLNSQDAATPYLTLVGGGWIVMADSLQRNGFALQPLPWRQLEVARAASFLSTGLGALGLEVQVTSSSQGRIWKCQLGPGVSYEAHDSVGRPCAVGAFWVDVLGQVWRLHYWFDGSHGKTAIEALGGVDTTIDRH